MALPFERDGKSDSFPLPAPLLRQRLSDLERESRPYTSITEKSMILTSKAEATNELGLLTELAHIT